MPFHAIKAISSPDLFANLTWKIIINKEEKGKGGKKIKQCSDSDTVKSYSYFRDVK